MKKQKKIEKLKKIMAEAAAAAVAEKVAEEIIEAGINIFQHIGLAILSLLAEPLRSRPTSRQLRFASRV